jgi:hypothetical protein
LGQYLAEQEGAAFPFMTTIYGSHATTNTTSGAVSSAEDGGLLGFNNTGGE